MSSLIPFIFHYIYSVAVIIPGLIVQRKLYKNIKNEEHLEKGKVIQRIIKTYTIVQSTLWPLTFILTGILFTENPILDLMNPSIIYYLLLIYSGISTIVRGFAAFHSLIIALCRYIFIVFSRKSDKIGIKRLRSIFITASVGIPILLAVLGHCTTSATEYLTRIGELDRYCQTLSNSSVELNHISRLGCDNTIIYSVVNNYFPFIIVVAMRSTYHFTNIIVYSNIPEAFIYAHTYIYTRRYLNWVPNMLLYTKNIVRKSVIHK